MVEALSVDHFIDALPESEIRLRLREVGPTTLAEAERIAVRMDAQRQADKQRTRLLGKVEQNSPGNAPNTANRWKAFANEWICFHDLFKTLVISKGYTCLCTRVMLQTKMRITITDQTDQAIETCHLKETFSTGEVIPGLTNKIKLLLSFREINIGSRKTFVSLYRGPEPG